MVRPELDAARGRGGRFGAGSGAATPDQAAVAARPTCRTRNRGRGASHREDRGGLWRPPGHGEPLVRKAGRAWPAGKCPAVAVAVCSSPCAHSPSGRLGPTREPCFAPQPVGGVVLLLSRFQARPNGLRDFAKEVVELGLEPAPRHRKLSVFAISLALALNPQTWAALAATVAPENAFS